MPLRSNAPTAVRRRAPVPSTAPKRTPIAVKTSPSSSKKLVIPSTPSSTTLHQRFLREVTDISPARPTPPKRQDSPLKGEVLEIGQNGFYFSCEIPLSKISPRKTDSPRRPVAGNTNIVTSPKKKTPKRKVRRNSGGKSSPTRIEKVSGTSTTMRRTDRPTRVRASLPGRQGVEYAGPTLRSSARAVTRVARSGPAVRASMG